jgi:hypothetical protein
MRIAVFKKLKDEGLISDSSLQQVEMLESRRLFSLFWELRLLLYLGVLLLTGGLGILVYKHIDTIGHQAVLAFIAGVSMASFFYCLRENPGFSRQKVKVPDPFFDYVLLLACLTLLIFLGYLQYQYDVFGDHYGTATFIPMVVLFFAAYYFDHLGALSLAITNLAAWAGIAITPLSILKAGNFSDSHLIFTGIVLGAVLLAAGELSLKRRLKAHFETTYANFGLHLFFIAGLCRLFTYDEPIIFVGLTLAAWFLYTQAFHRRSFYFIVVIILYAYIALSYVIVHLLAHMPARDSIPDYLGLLYFIFSASGLAILLVRLSHKLKAHDRL